ncbi:MAG: bifunctional adenosylcobinamide kinase/adenosylcobinamide-phosphate guanylyltransferase [Nitrospirae bacterium]|nr:bifunctional adenosylcobinamide kinase/adenosylcobinamide-phosphate guanylyltransferase [Nitrospirota bacterium]
MNRLTLILGGARSGKSRFAMEHGKTSGVSKYYIATAQALDAEMIRRIKEHRRQRPSDWTTIEEPLNLSEALQSVQGKADIAVIDCLTLWLSNLLIKTNGDEKKMEAEIDRFIRVATRLDLSVVAVSNEVGLGIVPADPMSRLFRDMAGILHQRFAEACHEVYWMTAGIAVKIKGDRNADIANRVG